MGNLEGITYKEMKKKTTRVKKVKGWVVICDGFFMTAHRKRRWAVFDRERFGFPTDKIVRCLIFFPVTKRGKKKA